VLRPSSRRTDQDHASPPEPDRAPRHAGRLVFPGPLPELRRTGAARVMVHTADPEAAAKVWPDSGLPSRIPCDHGGLPGPGPRRTQAGSKAPDVPAWPTREHRLPRH
jgi:hypothetical protein